MKYSQSNLESIVKINIGEWSRRSHSELLLSKAKGCFVYYLDTDKQSNSSGMFYTYDIIPNHFGGLTASKLQKMIQESNHEKEIVVALFFVDRIMIGRLPKIENREDTEVC